MNLFEFWELLHAELQRNVAAVAKTAEQTPWAWADWQREEARHRRAVDLMMEAWGRDGRWPLAEPDVARLARLRLLAASQQIQWLLPRPGADRATAYPKDVWCSHWLVAWWHHTGQAAWWAGREMEHRWRAAEQSPPAPGHRPQFPPETDGTDG